jgi:hypothetical protein
MLDLVTPFSIIKRTNVSTISPILCICQSHAKPLGLKYSDFLGRNDRWILPSMYSLEVQGSQLPVTADLALKTTNGFYIP